MSGSHSGAGSAQPPLIWWRRRLGTRWGVAVVLLIDLLAFTMLLSPSRPQAAGGEAGSVVLSSAGEG